MKQKIKPKAAFFDLAGCEGDQLQIANLEEKILDLLNLVEVVSFREVMKEHSDDYDIAFIEGSATNAHAEERLKEIRKNADIVVAIGACATIGGINSIRNKQDHDEVGKRVYGDNAELSELYKSWEKAKPIDAVIEVDYKIHGCPIDRDEFLHVVESLVVGRVPNIPDYPVCVECKLNENVCAFERDEFCVGPVTRAGCDACCVNEGTRCWGCRGLIDNPNEEAHMEVLEEYGLTPEDVMKEFDLYFTWQKEARENE